MVLCYFNGFELKELHFACLSLFFLERVDEFEIADIFPRLDMVP